MAVMGFDQASGGYLVADEFYPRRTTMKDSVSVNGVTLTRAQVEQALKDLNAPSIMERGKFYRYSPMGDLYLSIGDKDTLVSRIKPWPTGAQVLVNINTPMNEVVWGSLEHPAYVTEHKVTVTEVK